ncbi:hypothetical protein RFM26_31520 [Mesorhizobium sp. VK23B]|uniref:Uncharacterized protein n=1 Tax=Mesorhizobium dulcispinae TaxID=3072316 RepID=A0ABU4XPB1_9HYPH|nr:MULTISPECIES: hypothetical protein [unclassified Mesorhizobium]MDX8470210.1 hypothetical protein [Mesorhizobium sp. VK23B]MDX8476596.1 hypothetical protein [Mesorhizobium sp. VK23A]
MKVRDQLRAIAFEIGSKSPYYSSDDVISELRRKRPDLIRQESRKLEDIALRRILNDIESRQSSSFNSDQADLFSSLGGAPLSFRGSDLDDSVADKKLRMLLHKIPVGLLKKYVTREQPVRRKKTKVDVIKGLLEKYADQLQSDSDSLEDAIRRYEKEQRSRAP